MQHIASKTNMNHCMMQPDHQAASSEAFGHIVSILERLLENSYTGWTLRTYDTVVWAVVRCAQHTGCEYFLWVSLPAYQIPSHCVTQTSPIGWATWCYLPAPLSLQLRSVAQQALG